MSTQAAPINPPVTVPLGAQGTRFPIAHGRLAKFFYTSLSAEDRKLGFPASHAQMVWASIAIIPNPFATWQHVMAAMAELPDGGLGEIDSALATILPKEVTEEKKSLSESGPSPDSASG